MGQNPPVKGMQLFLNEPLALSKRVFFPGAPSSLYAR